MNRSKKLSLLLGLLGLVSILAAIIMLQVGPVVAQDGGALVPWPADFRYWFHVGSKSIRPEGAEAVGLPAAIFGNTMDAVYANTVALNDLRSGNRPFRDGAAFVAPFYALNPLADGGVDVFGDLAFTAVMVKDSAATLPLVVGASKLLRPMAHVWLICDRHVWTAMWQMQVGMTSCFLRWPNVR